MKKRIIISIIVLVGLLTTIVSYKYVYKETTEVKNELIGVYVSGEKTDKIPSSNEGYILEKYECNDETKIEWDYSTWSVILKDFKKGSSCDYYFVKGKQIKVTIKDEEGNIVDETIVGTTEGKTIKDLEKPEKPGHKFIGWKDKEGNKVDPNTPVEEIDELEAEYETEEYTVEISKGDENVVVAPKDSATGTGDSMKIPYGKSIEVTVTPTGGYYLLRVECTPGYTTNAKVGEEQTGSQDVLITNEGTEENGSCSFIVANSEVYEVTLNANGGKVEGQTTKTIKVAKYNKYGTLVEPTREGYTFTGWYTDETNGTKVTKDDQIKQNANHTIYAHWKPITYTITYTLNGGNATNPTSYTIETDTFTLNNPTLANNVFTGWSGTDLSGTSNTSVSIAKGSIGDRAYTAYFVDRCSSVTYQDGTTCSATCGGGTYNRLAYSSYDGQACPDKNEATGGSACNTQSCCVSNEGESCCQYGVGNCETEGKIQCDGSCGESVGYTGYKYWYAIDETNEIPYNASRSPLDGYDVFLSARFTIGLPSYKGVCISGNNNVCCVDYTVWQDGGPNGEKLEEGMIEIMEKCSETPSCNQEDHKITCSSSSFECWIADNKSAYCGVKTTGKGCLVESSGAASCDK